MLQVFSIIWEPSNGIWFLRTGGLYSSENKSLLQSFVALCMLDASEAYLEPQHSEAALPCDNEVHKYQGKELARVEYSSLGICPENSLQEIRWLLHDFPGDAVSLLKHLVYHRNNINNIEILVCSLKTKFSQKKDNKIKILKAKNTQT